MLSLASASLAFNVPARSGTINMVALNKNAKAAGTDFCYGLPGNIAPGAWLVSIWGLLGHASLASSSL